MKYMSMAIDLLKSQQLYGNNCRLTYCLREKEKTYTCLGNIHQAS